MVVSRVPSKHVPGTTRPTHRPELPTGFDPGPEVPADFVKAWIVKRADTLRDNEFPERILWTSADVVKALNVSPRADVTEIWVQKIGRVKIHQPEPVLVPWVNEDVDVLPAFDNDDHDRDPTYNIG